MAWNLASKIVEEALVDLHASDDLRELAEL